MWICQPLMYVSACSHVVKAPFAVSARLQYWIFRFNYALRDSCITLEKREKLYRLKSADSTRLKRRNTYLAWKLTNEQSLTCKITRNSFAHRILLYHPAFENSLSLSYRRKGMEPLLKVTMGEGKGEREGEGEGRWDANSTHLLIVN